MQILCPFQVCTNGIRLHVDNYQRRPVYLIPLLSDVSFSAAVDYRLEGGLSFSEISELLRALISTKRAIGMTITIFNPHLDIDGSIANEFVLSIVRGML